MGVKPQARFCDSLQKNMELIKDPGKKKNMETCPSVQPKSWVGMTWRLFFSLFFSHVQTVLFFPLTKNNTLEFFLHGL